MFLLTGFISAYFIFGQHNTNNLHPNTKTAERLEEAGIANPFSVKQTNPGDNARLDKLEEEFAAIKLQLLALDLKLNELPESVDTNTSITPSTVSARSRYSSMLTQRLYNIDNLVKGGIDSTIAEDIVRRKNSIELKRLALHDRATRDQYLNSQRYFDELSEINKQDITLREELGDERYDEYLFGSKQNNRIRISSVMLGGEAEQAGIYKGDIILSYDNKRMFSWQELKDATAEGQLGEYVSISVYRNGDIFSFTVPRGPLGMQLGAARLAP